MPPYEMGLTADVVAFSILDDTLNILLIKRKYPPFTGCWALPGGFVDEGEEPIVAAARELEEETQVQSGPLISVGTYATVGRDPRKRIITLAYFTLLAPENTQAIAGDDAAIAQWLPLHARPDMAFDHAKIIDDAHGALRAALCDPQRIADFFPASFTSLDFQRRFAQLYGDEVDTPSIWQRLLGLGVLSTEIDGQGPEKRFSFALDKLEALHQERPLPF